MAGYWTAAADQENADGKHKCSKLYRWESQVTFILKRHTAQQTY